MKRFSKILLPIAAFGALVGVVASFGWWIAVVQKGKSFDHLLGVLSDFLVGTASLAITVATIFFLLWLSQRPPVQKINPWIRIPGLLLCFSFATSLFHWSKFPANFVHEGASVAVFGLLLLAFEKWGFPPFRTKRQTLFDGEYDG